MTVALLLPFLGGECRQEKSNVVEYDEIKFDLKKADIVSIIISNINILVSIRVEASWCKVSSACSQSLSVSSDLFLQTA